MLIFKGTRNIGFYKLEKMDPKRNKIESIEQIAKMSSTFRSAIFK